MAGIIYTFHIEIFSQYILNDKDRIILYYTRRIRKTKRERAEILFKEYPGIHMAYGLSETKKADSKLNRLPS
ncbi:hypothetical protein DW158_21550, partial [Parabacteroides merdae]